MKLTEIPKESEIHPTKLTDKENEERLEKEHYADMKEFFDSQLSSLQIQGHMPFCSRCGKERAEYIGFIQGAITLTSFSFCIDCRDQLVLKQNAARAARERIGA